jgi:hypothetical protein
MKEPTIGESSSGKVGPLRGQNQAEGGWGEEEEVA